ncbi:MAG: S9 family peptidase [Bacteroidales bacterium]|nr:S9 family peptidase [Bacteroidales bacterium]
MKTLRFLVCVFCFAVLSAYAVPAQENDRHNFNKIEKLVDDVLLYEKLGDVAYIDKVRLAGPPKYYQPRSKTAFVDSLRDNPYKFYAYVFFPKEVKQGRKYPMVIFTHGGIHAHMTTASVTHIFRELLAQGYIVASADYRGSTGYGKDFYEAIDYGGLENEDVLAMRDYMVDNYSVVDESRIGLLGWSHGGMISLMNILQWPDKYTCAYAGVPVSDVGYRLSYQEPSYTKNFTQKYHVNATPEENPAEYARRSPVSYADRLCKPLMITTCANDDDVSWTEVNRMIEALKAAGKDFEYEIYPKMAGAHHFERIDVKEATDIRFKTYQFLARYLKPKHPFKNTNELRKAGYFFY